MKQQGSNRITAIDKSSVEGRAAVAGLIGETLSHAGEQPAVYSVGGFHVTFRSSRYYGYIASYSVECTDEGLRNAGAIGRYAKALTEAGWFVQAPRAVDEHLLVEVIGDALLECAPDWLSEKWEGLL